MSGRSLGLEPLDRLVRELARLPGIGARSAERIALHLVQAPAEVSATLADAVGEARRGIGLCPRCGALAAGEGLCPVCASPARDESTICCVEHAEDVVSIERAGGYRGLYHVLGGRLAPLDGIGPDDLRIAPLLRRVREGAVKEVVIATGADVEGEATATFLADRIVPLGVRVTRIAHGIPVGSGLGYADPATLARALRGRRSWDRERDPTGD